MQIYKAILFVFLLLSCVSNAQLTDDFSDGDFINNPKWNGDLQDFIVNQNYRLQLDAPDKGESMLYIDYASFDSIEWKFFFNMDFKPSNSNLLRVYLMVDKVDLLNANGYYLEFGENGSEDKIKFFKLKNGSSILLGEGNPGNFSSEPVNAFIKVSRKHNGLWQLNTDTGDGYYFEELELVDDEFYFNKPYFILNPKYSKSRSDKFLFDDISIKEFVPDIIPPKVLMASLLTRNKLELVFDEPVDADGIYNDKNYFFDDSSLSPAEIYFDANFPNKIVLVYNQGFESSKNYIINIKGLKDLNGNEILTFESITFYYIDSPTKGDIVINEVLFNPNTGGKDFIEIKNISNKTINLEGIVIINSSKDNRQSFIADEVIVKSGEYLCITKDTNDIINNYFIPEKAVLFQNKLPAFDDDDGNVSILYFDTLAEKLVTLDSFDYSEEMHSSFIVDYDGVSLERKNPFSNTNDRFNWSSGSTLTGGATPGYENSLTFELSDSDEFGFRLSNKVFSPNFDGVDDELLIEYKLESDNNLANLYVLDAKGRFVFQLVNNEILGNEGVVTWDGYASEELMPIGIYILFYNIVDIEGNTFKGKKTFVLADYLD